MAGTGFLESLHPVFADGSGQSERASAARAPASASDELGDGNGWPSMGAIG